MTLRCAPGARTRAAAGCPCSFANRVSPAALPKLEGKARMDSRRVGGDAGRGGSDPPPVVLLKRLLQLNREMGGLAPPSPRLRAPVITVDPERGAPTLGARSLEWRRRTLGRAEGGRIRLLEGGLARSDGALPRSDGCLPGKGRWAAAPILSPVSGLNGIAKARLCP